MTATHIGTWAMDKMIRFALLPRGGDPVLWDFGSAARHHQLYTPWLDEPHDAAGRGPHYGARAGISTLRGAIPPAPGRAEDVAARSPQVHGRLRSAGPAARRRHRRAAGPVRPAGGRASPSSTASRSSSRRVASRPPTRSACSPRPRRWSTPPTRTSTSSCGPACGRTSASGWSARRSSTSAPSTSRGSTRSRASAARRTRTSSPTG